MDKAIVVGQRKYTSVPDTARHCLTRPGLSARHSTSWSPHA
jgi:hypothetical protein